jgi:hypothetical protein
MRRTIDELAMRVQELESHRWNAATIAGPRVGDHTIAEYEVILGERDLRIMNMIDNQGKDIALDFTQLDKKV